MSVVAVCVCEANDKKVAEIGMMIGGAVLNAR